MSRVLKAAGPSHRACVERATDLLREARDKAREASRLLAEVECPQATKRATAVAELAIQAIKSAEGAERHIARRISATAFGEAA